MKMLFQLKNQPLRPKSKKYNGRLPVPFIFLSSISFVLVIFLLFSYISTPRIPILGFHGIFDINNPNLGIIQNPISQKMAYPMQSLERVLEYLVQNNYWFLSTQDVYDYFVARSHTIPKQYIGKKPIMLSFDDSYKTVYTNVIPVLEILEKKYNQKIKVVLFVNPGTLAKPDHPSTTYLSCEDLRTGFQKGFYDLQSHGQNHKELTKLSVEDLTQELAQAQTQLRECMRGLAPAQAIASHIAYPYGATNSQVEAYTAKYYQSGYLYDSAILRFRWLKNKYQISRLTVNREKSSERLIQMATRSFPISEDLTKM